MHSTSHTVWQANSVDERCLELTKSNHRNLVRLWLYLCTCFVSGIKKAVVEFTAASYAILESEKVVHIGIERTGNTKVAVTVQ